MKYELVKKLKEAGFPRILIDESHPQVFYPDGNTNYSDDVGIFPILSELIEAIKEKDETYFMLLHGKNFWRAGLHIKEVNPFVNWSDLADGETPEEAVAMLYLKLYGNDRIINKKI